MLEAVASKLELIGGADPHDLELHSRPAGAFAHVEVHALAPLLEVEDIFAILQFAGRLDLLAHTLVLLDFGFLLMVREQLGQVVHQVSALGLDSPGADQQDSLAVFPGGLGLGRKAVGVVRVEGQEFGLKGGFGLGRFFHLLCSGIGSKGQGVWGVNFLLLVLVECLASLGGG